VTLYLAYPDIPWRAVARAQSVTYTKLNDIGNTIHGERYLTSSATPGSGGTITLEWDLGSGVTSTIDYLIIARAKDLKDQGTTTITLDSSTTGTGGAYTNRYTNSGLQTATFYGPGSNDFIATGLALGAYRCWRFGVSGGPTDYTTPRTFCKLYFGNAFDFGVDPAKFNFNRAPLSVSTFNATSGASDLRRGDELIYTFNYTFSGMTDAKIASFYDSILRYSHRHRYFLYTTSVHEVLNNLRVLHCKLVSHSHNQIKQNWNELSLTFEQITG
jgi:hypothetical protein